MSDNKVFQAHYARASHPRAVEKRAAIRRALLDLLDQKAFDDITIPDITKAAGAGYTTFYRHYPGKQELLEDIAADEIGKLVEMVVPILGSGQSEKARRAAALSFCGYVSGHRTLWKTLLTGGAAAKLREQFIQLARQITIPQPEGHAIPVEAGCIFGVSSTIELLAWWLQQEEPMSVAEFAAIHEHLVIAPLCN